MKVRCVMAAVAIAVCGAVPAGAAPWKRVTTPDGSSTDQVGLARTGDGVLHVAWHHPTGPNTEDLGHTAIARAGRIGATSPIQSGWTGFTNTALVVEPGGLRAFWGGFRTTDSSDPQRETNTALSPDGGASWALAPGQVNPGGAQSYASSHAATVRADGSTLQTFAGTLGTWVHAGLSPATPNHDFMAGRQYGNDPNLATDATNRTVMAWYSNATGRLDVLANFNIDNSSDAVTSYRRLQPGLTLQAHPGRLRKGEQTEVRFTVRDAGDAASGAKVKVGSRSGTTDDKGRVTLTLKSSRALKARATRTGYTAATKQLGVRR